MKDKLNDGKRIWFRYWRWLPFISVFVAIISGAIYYGWNYGYDWSTHKFNSWADWTGFGEDTTIEVSTEKNGNGNIIKLTEIKKPQSGKTFWDVLNLTGTLAIPVLLAILSYQFQRRDQKRAEKQAQSEKDKADEYLRDEALQAYIDRMSDLLLDGKLIESENDSPVRDIARIRTLTILRRLKGDGERKARVLLFLYDAELLKIQEVPFIDLKDADFRESNLEEVNLKEVNLEQVNLERANLTNATLEKVNLKGANLQEANLQEVNLQEVNLQQANLQKANLQKVKTAPICFLGFEQKASNLQGANLQGANLQGAILIGVNLQRAKLREANLQEARLLGADLRDTDLSQTNLQRAIYKANNETIPFTAFVIDQTMFPEKFDPKAAGMEIWKITRNSISDHNSIQQIDLPEVGNVEIISNSITDATK